MSETDQHNTHCATANAVASSGMVCAEHQMMPYCWKCAQKTKSLWQRFYGSRLRTHEKCCACRNPHSQPVYLVPPAGTHTK